MINATDLTSKFALDVGSVETLKREARADPQKALHSAASQFEALMMQMMLKSMREAADAAGTSDSQDTKMYKSMLDQQLGIALAKRGIGLADIMVKQLGRSTPAEVTPAVEGAGASDSGSGATLSPATTTPPAPASSLPAVQSGASVGSSSLPDAARSFIGKLWPHAQEAARSTGIAPHFILGQAALESGWGRGEIRMADGSASHNLFGIKATKGWSGPTAEVLTTEYVNGTAVKTVEKFRAYGSYAEGFKDYANLLAANPRYAQVLNERTDPAAFARGLQQAGYATDPNYAEKLTRVITGSIMRSGLTG